MCAGRLAESRLRRDGRDQILANKAKHQNKPRRMRRLNHANIESRGNREICEIRELHSALGGRVWIFRMFRVFRGSRNCFGEDLGRVGGLAATLHQSHSSHPSDAVDTLLNQWTWLYCRNPSFTGSFFSKMRILCASAFPLTTYSKNRLFPIKLNQG